MNRKHKIKVPASSANLGPGYDCFAAAVSLYLELEVEEADAFSIDAGDDRLPADESNLCVRSFKSLCPEIGRFAFRVSSELPLAAGLGSSAAATVAGLRAANEFAGLELDRKQLLEKAVEIEGHADNVAAALYGGFVITTGNTVTEIKSPPGLEGVVVVFDSELPTEDARKAIPAEIPVADAVANIAAASALALGLERADSKLIAASLRDNIHQPRRTSLYPRSIELTQRASEFGALGATISGAGPTVLFWVEAGKRDSVVKQLRDQDIEHVVAVTPVDLGVAATA